VDQQVHNPAEAAPTGASRPDNTSQRIYDMTQAEPNARTEQFANPFRPGNGVAPPYLAGRDALLNAFDEYLAERPLHANWALTGLRGTGKTVLLGEFAARAEHAGWVTLQREIGERHRDDERLAALAPAVDPEAVRSRLAALAEVVAGDPAAGALGRLPQSERFGWIVAPTSTMLQPSAVHTGLTDDPRAAIERLFSQLVA